LLAGTCAADVHNPAPQEWPLLQAGATIVGDGILAVSEDARVVFCQVPPERVNKTLGGASSEQLNLKRTYRHTCFLITRLLGNLGVSGSTPLLTRFATPVETAAGATIVKSGDFGVDSDKDGVPDEWQFTPSSNNAACRREQVHEGADAWAAVMTCPAAEGGQTPSTMLAQHDVSVQKGQWYRISFQARAEHLAGRSATMAIANTATWKSFFDYQRFEPGPAWERFSFEVQSNDTADRQTRFQIWYEGSGELRLSEVRMEPIPDPAVGRWLEGFYLDVPTEWDDPYRFFRW
jgi:hypothetical protein